ncbi:MAG TPA: sulfite exporter TauE/SafE family protein [Armatimonadota bacterium]|jgi:hypothetical protein
MSAFLQSGPGLLLIGAIAGVSSGLFGIGGGLIMVPIFALVLQMDAKHATATSLAVVLLPVALPAVIKFHRAGNIEWRVVPWVALGFALCSQLGARINVGLSERHLRYVFAALLIVSAFQMAMKPPKHANAPSAGAGPAAPGAQR